MGPENNSFSSTMDNENAQAGRSTCSSFDLLGLIGIQRLRKMQQSFYDATGFANGCVDADGNLINVVGPAEPVCMDMIRNSPVGLSRCKDFLCRCIGTREVKPEKVAQCHAGMLDGRIPITVDGRILGFLVIGQIFHKPPEKEQALNYAEELGLDPEAYWQSLKKVKIVPKGKLEAAATLLEFTGNEIAGMASANIKLKKEVLTHRQTEDILVRQNANIKASLWESEVKYRSIMEAMEDGVVITAPDFIVEYMNPSMVRKVGRDCSGEVCFRALHGLNDRCSWCPQEAVMAGEHKSADIFTPLNNRNYHISSSPLLHADKSISHLCVYRDITEIKKLESRFQQAQKMESIGRLAGGIAHDFNNFLSVIIGTTELAVDSFDRDHPVYHDLVQIQEAAVKSADLTRQLLTFARQQKIVPRVLHLNDTVSNIFKMLQCLVGENIELKNHLGEDLWAVNIDPSQVDRILTNMCANARDAVDEGGKILIETQNITLSEPYCRQHLDCLPGEYVMLAVSDNGLGMDEETKNNIFEPFFTTKTAEKGTGLGLSTVYGIIKQNQGGVEVCSEVGMGTTFKMYFPRYCATGRPDSVDNAAGIKKGGETILLVEDDPTLLGMTKRMLESFGYLVLATREPCQAMEIITGYNGNVDLLLTDVIMPKINGRRLSLQISERFPAVRTLYISGYTANVIADHGVLEEGVHFLAKPYNREDLSLAIRKVLDQ